MMDYYWSEVTRWFVGDSDADVAKGGAMIDSSFTLRVGSN